MTDRSPQAWLVRHRMLVLFAIGAIVYVGFLGCRDLWYPDEPDIAEVCRAMFVSGDWIVPRRVGKPWIDYPPLLYWAACVTSHLLGGMSEFSLRLPSALAGIALALVTCSTVSRYFQPRAGLWAGLVLLTSVEYALNAVAYRTDMLFAVAIGAGTFFYAMGAGSSPRWWPRILGFACLGAAALVKGPVGLLLPGLVLTLWHLSRREWTRIAAMAPLTLVAIAVALPWYLAYGSAIGFDSMWHEIHAQNFERFDEGGRGHIRPWHYYLTRIWPNLAPWSVVMPFAIAWIVRSPLRRDRLVQLALWWSGTWFVFWSIAVTKREVYLVPAYPAVALLLGLWFSALSGDRAVEPAPDPRPARVFGVAIGWLAMIVGVGAAIGAATMGFWSLNDLPPDRLAVVHGLRWPLVALAAVLVPSAVWILRARRAPEPTALSMRVAGTAVLVYVVTFAFVMPAFEPARSYAEPCRWIRSQIGDGDRIGLCWPELAHHKMGAFAYYVDTLVDLLDDEAEVQRFFAEYPNSVVLVHEGSTDILLDDTSTDWRARELRELSAGGYRYRVFRGP